MGNEGNAGEGQGGQGQGAGQGSGQGAGQEGGQGSGQNGQGQGTGQGAGQEGGQGDRGQGAGQEGNQQTGSNMSLADIETALGMPLTEAKALLAAGKKPKEEPKGETLKGADLKIAKMEALMLRKVPSEKIPVLLQHLNIAGETLPEINNSIEALIQAGILSIDSGQGGQGHGQGAGDAQGGGGNAQGAGNQGLQNGGQQGKTIWTAAKVRELRKTGTITTEVLADIKRAEAEGRVRE